MKQFFNKKTIISSLIIISFILLILTSIYFIKQTTKYKEFDSVEIEMMTKEEIIQYVYDSRYKEVASYYFLIPVFGFFGVSVGATIYFIINSDLEKKKNKIDLTPVLNMLHFDERKVINKLIEEKGKIHQSDISYMDGFTKVKAHRVIEGLVKKGIVSKENAGKIRIIKLKKELVELFIR